MSRSSRTSWRSRRSLAVALLGSSPRRSAWLPSRVGSLLCRSRPRASSPCGTSNVGEWLRAKAPRGAIVTSGGGPSALILGGALVFGARVRALGASTMAPVRRLHDRVHSSSCVHIVSSICVGASACHQLQCVVASSTSVKATPRRDLTERSPCSPTADRTRSRSRRSLRSGRVKRLDVTAAHASTLDHIIGPPNVLGRAKSVAWNFCVRAVGLVPKHRRAQTAGIGVHRPARHPADRRAAVPRARRAEGVGPVRSGVRQGPAGCDPLVAFARGGSRRPLMILGGIASRLRDLMKVGRCPIGCRRRSWRERPVCGSTGRRGGIRHRPGTTRWASSSPCTNVWSRRTER